MSMRAILLILLAVTIFLALLAVLTAWVVQFILLSLTERRLRFLRWAALAAPALALCLGILQRSVIELALCRAGLAESAIWLGAAGALLLGWGLAWAAYRFQERRKEERI